MLREPLETAKSDTEKKPNTYVTHLVPVVRDLHLFVDSRHPKPRFLTYEQIGSCFCLVSGLMAEGGRGLMLDLCLSWSQKFLLLLL